MDVKVQTRLVVPRTSTSGCVGRGTGRDQLPGRMSEADGGTSYLTNVTEEANGKIGASFVLIYPWMRA